MPPRIEAHSIQGGFCYSSFGFAKERRDFKKQPAQGRKVQGVAASHFSGTVLRMNVGDSKLGVELIYLGHRSNIKTDVEILRVSYGFFAKTAQNKSESLTIAHHGESVAFLVEQLKAE